jgi:hypothetical protein
LTGTFGSLFLYAGKTSQRSLEENMAITFPPSPNLNDVYPPGAGTPGVSQWQWDGTKWNAVPVFMRLNNQLAYNSYVWPNTKTPTPGFQPTDVLGDGVLSWEIPGGPFIYLDDLSGSFNGTTNIFTLSQGGTPFSPDPQSNLIIVLGGIVQTPGISYTISGPQITFALAPASGAAFVGITNEAC